MRPTETLPTRWPRWRCGESLARSSDRIRTSHAGQARLDEASQIRVELSARQSPGNVADVYVHLRMRIEKREHLIEHRPSGVHHVKTQLRMPQQRVFE